MPRKEHMKKCFYITPIGDKLSPQYSKLEGLKENVLVPVLDGLGFELDVAHTIDSPGSISDQIFERIVNSELVIVNLTGLNANVMYELAVRHSFGKPCVMICETDTKLPFDLLAERTIFFEDTIKGAGELKADLDKKIRSALEGGNDNPVTRAVTKAAILEGNSSENEPLKLILSELNLLGKRLDNLELKNNTDYIRNVKTYSSNFKKNSPSEVNDYIRAYELLTRELDREASPEDVAAALGIPLNLSQKMHFTMKNEGLI